MSLIIKKERQLPALGSPEFTSRPIRQHPVIQALLRCAAGHSDDRRCWLGWGKKRSGLSAQAKAERNQEPFYLLEDGFIRSVEREDPPLSLLLDDRGMYYDARTPSRLEQLIEQPLEHDEVLRADALIEQWKAEKVSKYNASPEYSGELPENYVLVIDQVAGDSSIEYGLATPDSFQQALEAALNEYPESKILLKVHPDAFTRSRYGHFDLDKLKNHHRIQVINEACHPVKLIRHSSHVYVVTSQIGFEALIWNKKVTCFGMPFYAGWGLTDDRSDSLNRRYKPPVTLQQLVFSALVKYAYYTQPETGELCEVESIISWVGLQRRMRERFQYLNAPMCAIGFSRWKKPFVRQFLAGYSIRFVRNKNKCPSEAVAVVWGSKEAPDACKAVLRIEDGFLRSSGLGADLVRPLSWVIDDLGIYYDATRPSCLEKILSESQWSESELERAEQLRTSIVKSKLSKYNLSGSDWKRPKNINEKVILVPGQVPSDASIRLGCQDIRTNSQLLKIVRRNNPGSYIVYKPHPDVVAGLRKKDSDWNELNSLCDEVVLNADGMQMLEQIDEVHTMTSLMGFEALIREKTVYCYGQPFYSGWGLTEDYTPNIRRNRMLSLQQLCAGSLIDYPVYVSRCSGAYSRPEITVQELIFCKLSRSGKTLLWKNFYRYFSKLILSKK